MSTYKEIWTAILFKKVHASVTTVGGGLKIYLVQKRSAETAHTEEKAFLTASSPMKYLTEMTALAISKCLY